VCGGGFSERFSPLDSFLVVILYRSARPVRLRISFGHRKSNLSS